MNAIARVTADDGLFSILATQRASFLDVGAPPVDKRVADLRKLKKAILDNRKAIQEAIDADFGNRSHYETDVMEIMPVTQGIDYLRKHLRRWARPSHRHVAMQYRPGTAKVIMQPLGVIGIVSPWNYPVALCLTPLATAIAAGNRVMLKPSEYTPRTTALMADMLAGIFSEDEVAVVQGGPEVGSVFSSLPFDYLFFTGSTDVGRIVMRAASDNLVPVTLELGGKSPVVLDRGFSIARAAKSVVYGKLSNAGQTCVAPDYAFVHEEDLEAFVAAFVAEARRAYPSGVADPGYASIISQRHHDRLAGLIAEAEQMGARVIQIGADRAVGRHHTLAPTLIVGATPEMKVMQQEIFGPILPIITYRSIDETITKINARPRPLALYVFSERQEVVDRVLTRTTSGNASVNDTLLHFVQDDMPFGGVGASGMGAYHGEEGFRTFSHAKGVFTQARFNFATMMRAPFGKLADRVLGLMLP